MPSPRPTAVVNTPLRWVYPGAYRALESLAENAGIHPYEFQALICVQASAEEVLTVRRGADQWSRAFGHDDLAGGGAPVTAFFAEVIGKMVDSAKTEYQDFMSKRDV